MIVYRLDVEENGQKLAFIDFVLEHSVVNTEVIPNPEVQILTLSICTGRGHATLWMVQAVLREDCAN